jgi:chaperonin GroES
MTAKKALQRLKVVGDRVLIDPDTGGARTSAGLYLPPSVTASQAVKSGRVVAVGPGTPLPEIEPASEPWREPAVKPRYLPMEVEVGDFVLFLQKSAIEIRYGDREYLLVPLAGILLIERDECGDGTNGEPDLSDLLEN